MSISRIEERAPEFCTVQEKLLSPSLVLPAADLKGTPGLPALATPPLYPLSPNSLMGLISSCSLSLLISAQEGLELPKLVSHQPVSHPLNLCLLLI